jgi:NAD(P)-dependent dehydrogenase (short-subunit alcohol dehydrogenase family)
MAMEKVCVITGGGSGMGLAAAKFMSKEKIIVLSGRTKNFVVWYAKKCAKEYGAKGIRVCSLSPGLIATDMGKLEEKEGGSMLRYGAEKRMGTTEELGYAIATVADERNGYLAGVDILCDGGCTTLKKF